MQSLGLGSGEEERQAELDGDIPVFPSHPLQSQAVLWPPSPFQARPFECARYWIFSDRGHLRDYIKLKIRI